MLVKLNSFIAGVFGIVGFGLSMLAGVGAGNTVEGILTRSLISAVICYVVGYFVGLIAQQVAAEHAHHVAKMVAEADATKEAAQAEAQAQLDAEAAARGELVTPISVAPGGVGNP